MIVIVDTGLGNVGSIKNILKKTGYQSEIATQPDKLLSASHIILPGVGAFDTGMQRLREKGFIPVLEDQVIKKATPCLGICLGMQLMTNGSEEGDEKGLGWVDAYAHHFPPSVLHEQGLKVPHMGWNTISLNVNAPKHAVLDELDETKYYFIHSYAVKCEKEETSYATTNHGLDFSSVIGRENIMGVQFHPEKSHKYGMSLFKCFMENF